MKTKLCTRCGKEKIIILFPHDRLRPDGRAKYCKLCKREQVKLWAAQTTGKGVGKMLAPDPLSWRRVRD